MQNPDIINRRPKWGSWITIRFPLAEFMWNLKMDRSDQVESFTLSLASSHYHCDMRLISNKYTLLRPKYFSSGYYGIYVATKD